MRVCAQWTKATPSDWFEVDSAQWSAIAKRPEPVGGETIDEGEGWIFRVCVQGVEFTADHYAVEDLPDGACRVTIWNDDPEDYPTGDRYARVWTFQQLAPDARLGGRYNTRQSQVIYSDPSPMGEKLTARGQPWIDFSEFVPPPEAATRHGVWVAPEANVAHDAKRRLVGWREWTDGVPANKIDARGRLRQRARGVVPHRARG